MRGRLALSPVSAMGTVWICLSWPYEERASPPSGVGPLQDGPRQGTGTPKQRRSGHGGLGFGHGNLSDFVISVLFILKRCR
jgi:hypothetical protein